MFTEQVNETFDRDIYEGKITLKEADEDQLNLLNSIKVLKIKQDHKTMIKNNKKKLFLKTCINFLKQKK